jgi:hypothetical protein
MKRISRLLLLAIAVVAAAGSAAAQTPSGLLNILDLQRLVATDTPEAHATLAKHFVALADTYARDAARFNALATAPGGNPNHAPPIAPGARRARQATAAAQLAESARAMAAYHQLRSMSVAAPPPANRALFDGGLGAATPTAAEVDTAAASARTAADHQVLVEYFLTVEARETASANDHAVQARAFRVSGQRRGAELAAMHCDRMAKLSRDAATQAAAAAARHRQLASIG